MLDIGKFEKAFGNFPESLFAARLEVMDMAKEYFFVFYSALAVILLLGVQMKGKGVWHEDALSLPVSKGILGFCAVGIMLHHMSQTIYFAGEDAGILMFMVDIGVCFVGVFFFFSGYGLYSSLRDKPNYLHGFLLKRLPVIVIPFYMCNFVFIAGAALGGYSFQKGELLPYLTGYTLMNTQMWYIVEIFFLYLLFYLVFKLIKKKGAACLVYGIALCALTVGSLLLGHDNKTVSGGAWFYGEWWYNATMLLWIGMLFARYEKPILTFCRKYYGFVLTIDVLLTCFFYTRTMQALQTKGYWREWEGYPGYAEKFQTLAVQLPFIFFFVLFLILLTQKIQFKNKILSFLGEISLELYLVHNVFIMYLPVKNRFWFILAVYAAGIAAAALLHAVDKRLIELLKR